MNGTEPEVADAISTGITVSFRITPKSSAIAVSLAPGARFQTTTSTGELDWKVSVPEYRPLSLRNGRMTADCSSSSGDGNPSTFDETKPFQTKYSSRPGSIWDAKRLVLVLCWLCSSCAVAELVVATTLIPSKIAETNNVLTNILYVLKLEHVVANDIFSILVSGCFITFYVV